MLYIGFAQDITTIQHAIGCAERFMLSHLQMKKISDPTLFEGCPPLADPMGYIPYLQSELTEYQMFLVYLLRQLHDGGFRRYKGAVYEQIKSPLVAGHDGKTMGNYGTHAWKRHSEIKDFVLDHTSKETAFTHWQTMTTANNLERASIYLAHCTDPEFSGIKPDRMWHAFHNGLYYVETQRFFAYGDPRIPADVVACKYHDQPFDVSVLKDDWRTLKVPHVDDILRYQFAVNGKEDGVMDETQQEYIITWMYAFMGRLLYEVSEKDKWQVMPFILGRAGTGKSLLLKTAGHFFNEEDVEVLANNSQQGFGLETLVDKKIWMCYEVKKDLTLDQGQLQSMISGEPVSIMRKYKTPLNFLWKVPGMLAGNEIPSWVDNSGSMSRRMIMVPFHRKVKSAMVDPHLDTKIKSRIGVLLHKCACAYNAVYASFGGRDIWGTYTPMLEQEDGTLAPMLDAAGKPKVEYILPKYFHAAREEFQVATDPIMAFVRSDPHIILSNESVGMPFDRFKRLAERYFNGNGIKHFRWVDSKFKTVFDDLGIVLQKIDKAFIAANNGKAASEEPHPRYVDMDGTEYPVGTQWLSGIAERDGAALPGIAVDGRETVAGACGGAGAGAGASSPWQGSSQRAGVEL